MTETTQVDTTKWTTNKKIIVFSLLGFVVILSGVAAVVPSTREFAVSIVKMILEFVKVVII
jgi:hypothetical protein